MVGLLVAMEFSEWERGARETRVHTLFSFLPSLHLVSYCSSQWPLSSSFPDHPTAQDFGEFRSKSLDSLKFICTDQPSAGPVGVGVILRGFCDS